MVHWASSYFVKPKVILYWVNYLQGRKQKGELLLIYDYQLR